MPYPWSAGNVLTATDLNSALAAKTDTAMTQNAQTGTSYSYVLLDAAKLLTMNNASANTVTVTKQATVTWVTGTQLRVMNLGAGVTTLVADTGVTINGNVALKQYQGGTLIRTASDVWLFVPTASSSGMDLITPTSVAGTGVTLSGGQVSFSASTTVSVNGCFTSAYDVYQCVLRITGAAGDGQVGLRLRASGTDDSAANYDVYNVDTAFASFVSQTSWQYITTVDGGNNTGVYGSTFNVYGPALAQAKAITGQSVLRDFSGNVGIRNFGGSKNIATAVDGLSILGGSALTGSLRIYGLRNS